MCNHTNLASYQAVCPGAESFSYDGAISSAVNALGGEEPFMSQFVGVNTDRFVLNKAVGSTADNEIDSVSGASVSSGAIVNAVNAVNAALMSPETGRAPLNRR